MEPGEADSDGYYRQTQGRPPRDTLIDAGAHFQQPRGKDETNV
jgi:hypothetical protein